MASDISALIHSLSWWEYAGYVALAAVAIGVIGESIHEWTRWFDTLQWWWRPHGGKISSLVLVAALGAELFTQAETNTHSGLIIAFLDEQAESERLARIEIENGLSWRSLNEEQARNIVAKIKPFSGTPFELAVDPSTEPFFSSILETIITDGGGWQLKPSHNKSVIGSPAVGLILGAVGITLRYDASRENFQAPAKTLCFALAAAKIDCSILPTPTGHISSDTIHVEIGRKPNWETIRKAINGGTR